MKKNKNLYSMVLASIFAAIIFVLTRFVSIPTALGYVHLGDMAIYLCAAMLPTPYALAAAGIGGALADLSSGYVIYAPVTLIIKMLLALCFTSKKSTMINIHNLIAVFGCCAITVLGYFSFEIFYYGTGAYAAMLGNLFQAGASGLLFLVVAFALDKVNFKSRFATYKLQ